MMGKKSQEKSERELYRSPVSYPMLSMGSRSPTMIAAFELQAGPNLDIRCHRRAKLSISGSNTLEAQLVKLAAGSAADQGVNWKPVENGRMNSALSIGLKRSAYLVFMLKNDPSSSARLTFSSRHSAFMAGSEKAQARMFGPRCYVAGRLTGEFIPAPENPLVTVALFAADMTGLGNTADDFSFNINVEVVGRTENGFAYRTPIIIDPDLRYPPEGSGIPTEP